MITRVLIVEDERLVAAALQLRMERKGYRVVGTAATAAEAEKLALELLPDLVLMDINLDGERSGIEAAARIVEQVSLPVVFLTAYSDPDTLAQAGEIMPFGYLVKPIRDRDLFPTIEIALHRHRLVRERDELLLRLQSREEEIIRLQGLLPQCAWCQQVETREGYWQDLASYVEERLHLDITHGVCESCLARLRQTEEPPEPPG